MVIKKENVIKLRNPEFCLGGNGGQEAAKKVASYLAAHLRIRKVKIDDPDLKLFSAVEEEAAELSCWRRNGEEWKEEEEEKVNNNQKKKAIYFSQLVCIFTFWDEEEEGKGGWVERKERKKKVPLEHENKKKVHLFFWSSGVGLRPLPTFNFLFIF